MTSALDFATELARETGAMLKARFQRAGTPASLKPDRSLVTEADLEADLMITTRLQSSFPQDAILSEESHPHGIADIHRPVWVIDPLDGTTNFSLGLHIWGVLIARLCDGSPELAACYFPMVDECYTAQRGQGAFLNGERIFAQLADDRQPASFFACCGRTHGHYQVSVPYKPRILGSAAYSYCALARGAAILAFEATPKVWDLAGPWLLVPEADGVIQSYHPPDPFPLHTDLDYIALAFPTLAAKTAQVLAKGRAWIQKKP